MIGSLAGSFGWRWMSVLTLLVGVTSIPGGPAVEAHNNPGFKEVLILTVEVSAEPISEGAFPAHSEPFSIDLPKKTIELVWRIQEGVSAEITFAVTKDDVLHAEGLTDGANSRILRGGEVRIVDVEGAEGTFSIEVYANVIDRSNTAEG